MNLCWDRGSPSTAAQVGHGQQQSSRLCGMRSRVSAISRGRTVEVRAVDRETCSAATERDIAALDHKLDSNQSCDEHALTSMNRRTSGTIRWKNDPSYLGPDSRVASSRKFRAVMGQMWSKRRKTIRPAGTPSMETSNWDREISGSGRGQGCTLT